MSDLPTPPPIPDDPTFPDDNPYTPDVVQAFRTNPDTFIPDTELEQFQPKPDGYANPYPKRYYAQLTANLDPDTILELFARHDLDPATLTITVFGGYTGEYATVLDDVGADVIFTDPLDAWVDRARGRGLEAYQHTVSSLPTNLLDRTDLFTTFECFHPLEGFEHSLYRILRLLTVPHGIVFLVSQYTLDNLKGSRLKSAFNPIKEVYGIRNAYRQTNSVRAYQFCATDAGTRDQIRQDVLVLYSVYLMAEDTVSDDEVFTVTEDVLEENLMFGRSTVRDALTRVYTVSYECISDSFKRYERGTTPSLLIGDRRVELPVVDTDDIY